MFPVTLNTLSTAFGRLCLSFCLLVVAPMVHAEHSSFRQQLGQKLILDIRYFCESLPANGQCREPVTELPEVLANMLVEYNIGGVILFAENLESVEQIVTSNYTLQRLAKNHNMPPFIIAVDQEGGRVARLPDDVATRFGGNMAIGATVNQHGTYYAEHTATGMAKALRLLGFNTNFAPSVDINNNPKNPVINVRSFSDTAKTVARLGKAMSKAMQDEGIVSAIKHFPGHGDTSVDSHTGLPQVTHSKAHILKNEVYPFAALLRSDSPPDMLMTAHIQYPALDSTKVTDKSGTERMLPATLSRRILHDVLRDTLQYKGVVVTDALDMAGIAHYFTPEEAVVKTFLAGTDIALMPFTIRSKKDIQAFETFLQKTARLIKAKEWDTQAWQQSLDRIASLKQRYQMGDFASKPLTTRLNTAKLALPLKQNKTLEQSLALASVTMTKGRELIPLKPGGHWWLLMPDEARCQAMENAFAKAMAHQDMPSIRCTSLATQADWPTPSSFPNADVVVVGDISPLHSVVEMGGMDDLSSLPRVSLQVQREYVRRVLTYYSGFETRRVLLALRTPYVLQELSAFSDIGLATYSYNVNNGKSGKSEGPAFNAIAQILLGQAIAQGALPVRLN